jgi:hypothetical protein
VLNDLALSVDTEDINPSPVLVLVGRPLLMAVENDIVSFRYNPLELHTFARVVLGHPVEVVNEGLFAIRHMRIVLNVCGACIPFDCLSGSALIEHQVVERNHVSLVTFQRLTAHLDLQRAAEQNPAMTPNVRDQRARNRAKARCEAVRCIA